MFELPSPPADKLPRRERVATIAIYLGITNTLTNERLKLGGVLALVAFADFACILIPCRRRRRSLFAGSVSRTKKGRQVERLPAT